jgi:hypothetical protein
LSFPNLLYRICYSTIFRSLNIFFHCYCIMHKSRTTTTTFVLLASSLVMLSLMPLFSQQQNSLFSNVMAQGYDNYGYSYYSQYPTDDKKYECRTGPFEGFFVSSVEFCKFNKFDDKKDDRKDRDDNRTGTQGPPGPQGPPGANGTQGPQGIQGLTGQQGPSGITQLNATNIYSVINASSPEPGDTFTSVPAFCDPGDLVLNGGYNLLGSNLEGNDSVTTIFDQPIVDPIFPGALGAGWFTFVSVNDESSVLRLNVFALCFDNPPLR